MAPGYGAAPVPAEFDWHKSGSGLRKGVSGQGVGGLIGVLARGWRWDVAIHDSVPGPCNLLGYLAGTNLRKAM